MAITVDTTPSSHHPVALTASLDPGLSRWTWLVKWFLAIPHVVVLALLWPAFLVVTVIAGFCILVTGRYPRSLFDFTKGVLRWTWRVSYYATTGGLGTDRYPPFSFRRTPRGTRQGSTSLTRHGFLGVWCWSSGCWRCRTC